MGGKEALDGFTYQKDYAAYRVLSSELSRIIGRATDTLVTEFTVEGGRSKTAAWDFEWRLKDGSLHFRECKDTKITKADRITFYRRVRRQFQNRREIAKDTIGWVTTSEKQGKIASHLEWASKNTDFDFKDLAFDASKNVVSGKTALREALFYLCEEPASKNSKCGNGAKPLGVLKAKSLLSSLKVELHRSSDLAKTVADLASSVFDNGIGAEVRKAIQGEFDALVQSKGQATYSRTDFLDAIKVSELSSQLSGVLKSMVEFNSGGSIHHDQLAGVVWSNLDGRPTQTWRVSERLDGLNVNESILIHGATGAGKTTTLKQIGTQQVSAVGKLRTLFFSGRNTSLQMIEAIPSLCAMLCSTGAAWIGIDGLDEANRETSGAWQRCFQRMQQVPQLTIAATVRTEVFGNQDWIESIAFSLGDRFLPLLTKQQVQSQFEAVGLPPTKNASLLQCLRTPFLFRLFAQIVEPGKALFDVDVNVESFHVIEEFWQRRVKRESVGIRCIGDPSESQVRKEMAARYLGERTLAGDDDFSPASGIATVNGIKMLQHEGIVAERSGGRISWTHAWFREYVLVDTVLGGLEDRSPERLSGAVGEIEHDHIAKDAVKGVYKCLIANGEVGEAQRFLESLYNAKPSLARALMFDIAIGSEKHIQLVNLPNALLAELVEVAVVQRASEWHPQIAHLSDDCFVDENGSEVLIATIKFESEIAYADEESTSLLRMIARHGLASQADEALLFKSEIQILDFAINNSLSGVEPFREWAKGCVLSNSLGVANRIASLIVVLIDEGYQNDAAELFSGLLGLSSQDPDGLLRRNSILSSVELSFSKIKEIFKRTELISNNIETWGGIFVKLQSQMVRDLRADFDNRFSDEKGRNATLDTFFLESLFDDMTVDKKFRVCGEAITRALAECTIDSTAERFCKLTELLRGADDSFSSCLPCIAMIDYLTASESTWHENEAANLLISNGDINAEFAAKWHRLIWQNLKHQTRSSYAAQLLNKYRDLQDLSQGTWLEILHDLRPHKVLNDNEIKQLNDANLAGRSFPVHDPRKRVTKGEPFYDAPPDDSNERFVNNWSYPNERDAVGVLIAKPENNEGSEAKLQRLEEKLLAVNVIASQARQPDFSSEDWTMEWCATALSDLREIVGSDSKENTAYSSVFFQALNTKCPWWEIQFDFSLQWLNQPLPNRGLDHDMLSVPSGDGFAASVEFLEQLCVAVDELEHQRQQFHSIIAQKWSGWNPYTQSLLMWRIRPWHWVQSPALQKCLRETATTCNSSNVVKRAVEHLVRSRVDSISSVLSNILDRIDSFPEPGPLAYYIGKIIGDAVYRAKTEQNPHSELIAIRDWFSIAIDNNAWPDEACKALVSSYLHAATNCFTSSDPKTKKHASLWASECAWGLREWLDRIDPSDDTNHLPESPVRTVRETAGTTQIAKAMFEILSPTLATIISKGGLGEFFSIHYELSKSLNVADVPAVAFLSDQHRLDLCVASTERLVKWTKVGKTTNDLAYGSSVAGQDTARLIELCFVHCDSQKSARRDLAKCVDLIAEVGKRDLANQLRKQLRSS